MPKKQNSGGTGPLAEIQEFYRFMVDQQLETLEYDHQDLHVRLVRRRLAPVPVPIPVASGAASSQSAPLSAAANIAAPRHGASAIPEGAISIKAPMMGIFYRASTPSSPPFVRSGEQVKKGQVLCLIEAMKVFNEVKAEFDCVIIDLLLENGKPVKAGQDIIAVKKP